MKNMSGGIMGSVQFTGEEKKRYREGAERERACHSPLSLCGSLV